MSAARAGALEVGLLIARLSPPVQVPSAEDPQLPATAALRLGARGPIGRMAAGRLLCILTPQGGLPTVAEELEAESQCSTADTAGDVPTPGSTPGPTPAGSAVGTVGGSVGPSSRDFAAAAEAPGMLVLGGAPPAALATCGPQAVVAAPPGLVHPRASAPPGLHLAVGSTPGVVSMGSLGHNLGLCKPCAFFLKDGCRSGADCKFCHLCESGEKKRRKKERKAVCRAASAQEGAILARAGVGLQAEAWCLAMHAATPHWGRSGPVFA